MGNEIEYDVPGADIIAKLQERADTAEKIAYDLSVDGKPALNSCERGIVDAAERDMKSFRLRAKYLLPSSTYKLTAVTLSDIFTERDQYGVGLGQIAPEAAMERRW